MTGVEILASEQVITEYAFNWMAFWIGGGIIFTTLITFLILSCINDDLDVGGAIVLFCISVLFSFLGGGLFGEWLKKPTQYTTEHKVTISDEVSMIEFYEYYDVINQDGKIFTVREKQHD